MSSHGDDTATVEAITAEEFKRASRASLRTADELASLIGVSRAQVYNYRSNGVTSPRAVERVRRRMALWLRNQVGDPYDGFTDDDLLNELGRRIADLRDTTQGRNIPDDPQQAADPRSVGDPLDEGVIDGTLGKRPRSDDGE